jgi:hypothetical protein
MEIFPDPTPCGIDDYTSDRSRKDDHPQGAIDPVVRGGRRTWFARPRARMLAYRSKFEVLYGSIPEKW